MTHPNEKLSHVPSRATRRFYLEKGKGRGGGGGGREGVWEGEGE